MRNCKETTVKETTKILKNNFTFENATIKHLELANYN